MSSMSTVAARAAMGAAVAGAVPLLMPAAGFPELGFFPVWVCVALLMIATGLAGFAWRTRGLL